MKTLYLIRHAKSSWNFSQLDDFSRPIGIRGRKDVRKIGKYLQKHISRPEKIVTSPASRAFYTALHFADYWAYPEEEISLEPALYHADDDEIIEIIKDYGENYNTLAVFGHNPGFTNTINSLQNNWVDNLPTCAAIGISFEVDDWNEIEKKKGKQVFYVFPKSLK